MLNFNEMMEAACKEFDDKVVECTEVPERIHGHFEQATYDLHRAAGRADRRLAAFSETVAFIKTNDLEIRSVQATLKQGRIIHRTTDYEHTREINIRRDDLPVFQFVPKPTTC